MQVLLGVGVGLLVIVAATQIVVGDQGGRGRQDGLGLQLGFEDGFDTGIRADIQHHRPLAGLLQPAVTVVPTQARRGLEPYPLATLIPPKFKC